MNNWKSCGKIYKEFDYNIQGYISIFSNSSCKIEIDLTHNFLVFQLFLISNRSLIIEISESDILKVKFK